MTAIKVHDFSTGNSLFNNFIAEIRDEKIQQDSMRFRRNIERIGEVMAYELSKTMEFEEHETITPLGSSHSDLMIEKPVIATILRAGLPLHQGFLNYFDQGESAFVSAYRRHTKGDDFVIEIEYLSSPSIEGKTLILTDPMLATGSSMVMAYQALLQRGKPKHIHVATVIASAEGIEYTKSHLPENTTIWAGAIDAELTAQSYIVPGLGDAGDLAYGSKV